MTRVFPSQAVATIEQLVPWSRDSAPRVTYSFEHAGLLRGIVDLVKQIPQELLILPADQYANLIITLGVIEHYLQAWASRDALNIFLQNVNGRDPVVLIREALLQCPDDYPPPSTADLKFIDDEELRDSIRRDVGAASQALHNGEWKAATVLAGAAIEALLHWKLGRPPLTSADLSKASSEAVSQGKLKQKPRSDLDRWKLEQYIEVASVLNLIKPDTVTAANLARNFRDLIHPGRVARLESECNRATALSALAGLEHVINDLSRWPLG
jgi:hypothetical protein